MVVVAAFNRRSAKDRQAIVEQFSRLLAATEASSARP